MRRIARALVVLVALVWAGAAFALDLDSAKAQGVVGERIDGYVAAVSPSPSADVQALVAEVNRKRKATYAEIATRNGTPVAEVAKLAAKKLLDRAPSGAWFWANDVWYQKK